MASERAQSSSVLSAVAARRSLAGRAKRKPIPANDPMTARHTNSSMSVKPDRRSQRMPEVRRVGTRGPVVPGPVPPGYRHQPNRPGPTWVTVLRQDAELGGAADGAQPVADLELLVDALDVVLDRIGAEPQQLGDALVAVTVAEQAEDLLLARRQ